MALIVAIVYAYVCAIVSNQGCAVCVILRIAGTMRDIRDYVVVPHNIAPEGAHQVIKYGFGTHILGPSGAFNRVLCSKAPGYPES